MNEVDQFFPDLHYNLLSHDSTINKKNLVSQYSKLVLGDDQEVAKKAAVSWNQFEGSILKLMPPENAEPPESINFDFELARAKVQLHYIQNQCFVDGEEILNKASILKDKPIIIVQGRYDMICPPQSAWDLAKAWPKSDLRMIRNAGHAMSEPGISAELVRIMDLIAEMTD